MDTTRKSRQGLGRRFRRLAAVATLAVLLMGTLGASSSEAVTAQNSGRPGAVYVTRTAAGLNSAAWNVTSGATTVYRSPASTGTQYIKIQWRVWQYSAGKWTLKTNPAITYTVYSGQYVAFNGWTYESPPAVHLATDQTITWTSTTGAVLGTSFIDFVHAGDYQCFTASPYCQVTSFGGQYGLWLY